MECFHDERDVGLQSLDSGLPSAGVRGARRGARDWTCTGHPVHTGLLSATIPVSPTHCRAGGHPTHYTALLLKPCVQLMRRINSVSDISLINN
jgi:hypothetical protein